MCVDDENRVAEENYRGIAIDLVGRLGDGCVDAVGHGFDVEEILIFISILRVRNNGVGKAQQNGEVESASHAVSPEVI